ncbi:hypothetical protein [Nocardia mexicana]|uniref:Uncharacterized protein n=1 Tax=Nocardia mexicana TaxID=279262 RepID=A0A370H7J7_9NOCA|nr:hypothetical protein [Nocardia mexicana]RDI52662.1 hypothetical protein DFR68_10346 [Nocardia mexicana]
MNEKYSEEMRSKFDGPELEELDSCRYRVNDYKSFGVLDLLVSWKLHTEKIDSDRFKSPGDRGVWGGYDLVAALSVRDFLADCIDQLSEPLRNRIMDLVDECDELFRSISVSDDRRLLDQYADSDLSTAPWWWHRIPDSGPLRAELVGA